MLRRCFLAIALGGFLTGAGTAPLADSGTDASTAEPQAEGDSRAAQTWLERGRPGRALASLDASPAPATAERLQLEWQAASAARDYERLLRSARSVVAQPVDGLDQRLAPFWAAHAALWLRKTSAANSALIALEESLQELEEAERANWQGTVEEYRTQVADAEATAALTAESVSRAKATALTALGLTLIALLLALRR